MNQDRFIPLLLIFVAFLWGGSFLVVKYSAAEIDAVDLGFLRFLVATPLLLLYLKITRNIQAPPRSQLIRLAVLGLSGVTLLYLFQFVGIRYTNASTAAVLINTNVIYIALFSVLILKEKLTKKRIVGIILSFFGVIGVVFSNITVSQISFSDTFFLGSILMLLSALCWAIYTIVGKQVLTPTNNLTITTYAFALGTVFYLPFVMIRLPTTLQTITFSGWLAVLYLALLCSIVGYLGWYYALSKIDASKAAIFLNFIPLFAIAMSVFVGERLTPLFFLGAALILVGFHLAYKN